MERFPGQEAYIDHLESFRWGRYPLTHNVVVDIIKKKESGIGCVGRCWHCHDCGASFKGTGDTVFYGTKIAYQK